LNEKLDVYGFGSFFNEHGKFQDIDILIVHRSGEYESCQFAIMCKRFLLSELDEADVSILSEREERWFSFIEKSNARHIGKVYEVSTENNLHEILNKIQEARMLG
jgi:hypothetical protein